MGTTAIATLWHCTSDLYHSRYAESSLAQLWSTLSTGTSDYSTITNQILELSEGNPTAQVTIDIADDDILEDYLETFQVHLSLGGPVTEAITISPSVADIYIRNVDGKAAELCEACSGYIRHGVPISLRGGFNTRRYTSVHGFFFFKLSLWALKS